MAKTIAIDSDRNVSLVYLYDAGTGTYTSLSTTGATDLFDDSFEVGDILYFAHSVAFYSIAPMAFKFDIDVAMAATSYTLVWEYYDYVTGWTAFDWIEDDTQSFSVTGANYVRFRPKDTFYYTTVNGASRAWVRCRVTSVSGATEGGHVSSQFKTKWSIISISGGTSGTPITMADIYADSTVQAWSLVDSLNTYNPIYLLHIGVLAQDAASYFADYNCDIVFPFGYTQGGYWTLGDRSSSNGLSQFHPMAMYVSSCRNDANIRWSSVKYTMSNVDVMGGLGNLVSHNCDFDLYNTSFRCASFFGGGIVNLENCFIKEWSTYLAPSGYEWTVSGGKYGALEAYQSTAGFLVRDADVYQIVLRWSTKFIGFDTNYTTLAAWSSVVVGSSPGYAYMHNSVNLVIQDSNGDPIQGATVDIKDANGNTPQYWSGDVSGELVDFAPLTTDVNGEASTDLLRYMFERVFDPSVVTTVTTYAPFTITVKKAGYLPETLTVTLDVKMTNVIVLKRATMQIDQEGGVL